MSTIGLSLAVFTGYVLLSGSPQIQTPNSALSSRSNIFAASATPIAEVQKKMEVEKREIAPAAEILPTPPVPPPAPPTQPTILTPVKVAGIHPLPLAPEKFAKMGIAKKDDGTISFTQKNDNGHLFTMSFPQNSWGIVVGGDDNKDMSDAPHFAPMIVTDTKGNKRLMQFSSDINGKKMRGLEIQSRADNDDVDPKQISDIVNNALKIEGQMQIGGKDGDIDFMKLGLDSSDLKELHNAINMEMNIDINIDSNQIVPTTKQKGMKMMIYNDKHVTDTLSNGKHQKTIIMKRTIRMDSTFQAAKGHVLQARQEIEKVIKKLNLKNLDSSNSQLQMQLKELTSELSDGEANENILSLDIPNLEKMMPNFEGLVPVKVRNATTEHFNKGEGITFDDGLIFWYQPDKDLLAAVPEVAQQSGTLTPIAANPSVISKTALYPNPARNRTTVSFVLSEPRTVAFSIHDLLGKRVLDGGSISGTASGNYEKELDLHELTAGVYLLVITTDKGEQSIQRLVIEK